MRLHGGSLVAASDSIHNPNQGTVRVTEPSHPKFKYGVGKSISIIKSFKLGLTWDDSLTTSLLDSSSIIRFSLWFSVFDIPFVQVMKRIRELVTSLPLSNALPHPRKKLRT